MGSNPLATILAWIQSNPGILNSRQDEHHLTLKESTTGKSLTLDLRRIHAFRLTPHPASGKEYLNLVFDDGMEIVLCHAGIAFSPSFISTGPVPDAPPVTCMGDYATLLQNLQVLIADARKQEALLLFNVLISILDGAKAVGLEVGAEEEELDKRLKQFEQTCKN